MSLNYQTQLNFTISLLTLHITMLSWTHHESRYVWADLKISGWVWMLWHEWIHHAADTLHTVFNASFGEG